MNFSDRLLRGKGLFIFFSLVILVMVASLRLDIGTDYKGYEYAFDVIKSIGTYSYIKEEGLFFKLKYFLI